MIQIDFCHFVVFDHMKLDFGSFGLLGLLGSFDLFGYIIRIIFIFIHMLKNHTAKKNSYSSKKSYSSKNSYSSKDIDNFGD